MTTLSPEKLAIAGVVPDLFYSAENYARAVKDNPPTYPLDPRAVESVVDALNELAATSIKYAEASPVLEKIEPSLRWVSVAQKALKDCGRFIPELKGYERTRQFSPSRSDAQRRIYFEVRFNIVLPGGDGS